MHLAGHSYRSAGPALAGAADTACVDRTEEGAQTPRRDGGTRRFVPFERRQELARRTRKVLAVLLALGLAVSVLGVSACTSTETTKPETPAKNEPVKGGEMIFGDMVEPAYIDPYNGQETSGIQVIQSIYDSLTMFNPTNTSELLPAAAASWEPNSDATVWTFKLQPDATFHNGQKVTAQDFIYAWNRIVNPKVVNTITGQADPSTISYHLSAVKGYDEVQAGTATELSGLKAVDDLTLEVTMAYPFADFEYVVAHPSLGPVPKDAVENGTEVDGKKVAFGDMPIGNGPFKMAEPWKHNEYIRIQRYDDYWGDKTLLDSVKFAIFKDTNTEFMEFEAGNLDFSIIGDGQIAQTVAKYGEAPDGYTPEPGKQCVLGAEAGIYYLNMNNVDPAMKNANLRKAVSLCINRQAISDTVYDGTRVPADNFLVPGIAGYEKGGWPDSKYDVAAAKQALADAGFPGGQGAPELKLSYNADGGHQPVMELIQADLKAIGLTAKLDPQPDFATYLKQLNAGKVQLGRLGWIADYPIADNFLYSMFDSTSGENKSKYSNPDVDKALNSARAVTDTNERIAAYQEINSTIAETNPVAPVMFYRHHHVGSDRIHDFTYDAFGYGSFSKAWLTGGGK